MMQDHDAIRSTIAEIRALMAKQDAASSPTLSRLRWRLTRDLLLHMSVERDQFRRNGVLDHARGWDGEAVEVRYRSHLARWTVDRIAAHWVVFSAEFGDLLRAIERCMAYEEMNLYPSLYDGARNRRIQ